jgi:hypothetical protein
VLSPLPPVGSLQPKVTGFKGGSDSSAVLTGVTGRSCPSEGYFFDTANGANVRFPPNRMGICVWERSGQEGDAVAGSSEVREAERECRILHSLSGWSKR